MAACMDAMNNRFFPSPTIEFLLFRQNTGFAGGRMEIFWRGSPRRRAPGWGLVFPWGSGCLRPYDPMVDCIRPLPSSFGRRVKQLDWFERSRVNHNSIGPFAGFSAYPPE